MLNPVKRELSYITLFTKLPVANQQYTFTKAVLDREQDMVYKKGIFRYLLAYLQTLYVKGHAIYYKVAGA